MHSRAEIRSHYAARWGEPSRNAYFEVGSFRIEVYKWHKDKKPEGVTLYATNGASAWPVRGHAESHRFDFFIGLSPAEDDIASPLVALGLYAVRENVNIDHGHSVPAGKPLWPGSRMSSFLVVEPRMSFFAPLELSDGLHVSLLQAIPIFDSERVFNSEHGVAALMEGWEQKNVPFWRADRLAEP